MAKRHLKKGRVVLAMAVVAGSLICVDHIRRDLIQPGSNKIVVNGSFKESTVEMVAEDAQILGNIPQETTEFLGMQNVGFSEINLYSSALSRGDLVLVDEQHQLEGVDKSEFVDLMDEKNEYYTLVESSVMLKKEAAEALNLMMADYCMATGLSDFIVYGTTDTYTGADSFCPQYFPESITGNTIDLAINGCNAVLSYDGRDEESWVVDNCAKYGFIVRYPENKESATSNKYCPWHLRYVGKAHSAIMAEKNLCLEEYIDFLKAYTFDKPFRYSINEVNYEIYSARSTGDSTAVMIPVGGNYSISGDNRDSYVITTIKG